MVPKNYQIFKNNFGDLNEIENYLYKLQPVIKEEKIAINQHSKILIKTQKLSTFCFKHNIKNKHYNIDSVRPFDAVYFTIITSATVGFGDIHPVSDTAKFVTMLNVLFSILTSSEFLNSLNNLSNKRNRMSALI